MAQVAGITTKKNTKGEITHVTFNVKKHKDTITPILNQLGVMQITEFQKKCENSISLEQGRKICQDYLKEIWTK